MSLTLQEKIGQMIMTGFDGAEFGGGIRKAVEEKKIGNLILFPSNIESTGQVRELCLKIQECVRENTGLPAFIAVDQEGGMVSRVPPGCTGVPGNMAVAATADPQNAYRIGRITSSELHALGFNIDFAPVLDINTNPDNPVIGVRSYGDKKKTVRQFGLAMTEGLKSGGVMPVAKHFPGHGDTAVDSHLDLPTVGKSLAQISQNELVPFQSAIDAGIEGVMTAHILFPQIEKGGLPATMSKTILTGLLRERMNFRGLIFTDCLEMDAIKKYYGTVEGAVAAVKAGADIVLISHTVSAAAEAAEKIEAAVESGEIPVARIDESAERILRYKEKYARYDAAEADLSVLGCDAHRREAKEISLRSITALRGADRCPAGGRILFVGCRAARVTPVSDSVQKEFNFPEYMAAKMGGDGLLVSLDPTPDEMSAVLERSKDFDSVVVGTYNGSVHEGQIELVHRLCGRQKHVVAVALRNPYDLKLLDGRAAALAAYEYTALAFDSVIDVLKGSVTPSGKPSVKI